MKLLEQVAGEELATSARTRRLGGERGGERHVILSTEEGNGFWKRENSPGLPEW